MGLTIDQDKLERVSDGSKWKMFGQLTFDDSYTSGGEFIAPEQIGLVQIDRFMITGNEGGFLYEFDYVNGKLKVLSGGGGGTFVGDPLPSHNHPLVIDGATFNVATIRLYVSLALQVGVFQVGEVVTGSVSGDTATITGIGVIANIGVRYLIVTAPTGNFSILDTITGGTSGATSKAVRPLINNWSITPPFGVGSIIEAVTPQSFVGLAQLAGNILPFFTNTVRATHEPGFPAVETLRSDGFTEVNVGGLRDTVFFASAGTPTGTIVGSSTSPASEVPGGTDLSVLSAVEFEAIGL